jgi:hypothetical protein
MHDLPGIVLCAVMSGAQGRGNGSVAGQQGNAGIKSIAKSVRMTVSPFFPTIRAFFRQA